MVSSPPSHRACVAIAAFSFSLAATILGCGTDDTPRSAHTTFEQDPQAARIDEIRLRLAQHGTLSPLDADLLFMLGERYPEESEVQELLEQVLIGREDWNALVRLRSRTPAEERSTSEWGDLATLLIKAQRFDEAIPILDRIIVERPDEIEYRWLHGYADYFRGEYAGTVATFERFEPQLLSAGHSQCILLRGLSHFQLDHLEKAIEDLSEFVRLEPDNISGYNGLARALVAVGREEEAEPLLARVVELHDRQNAMERQRAYLASRTRELNQALAERRLEESKQLIEEILPHAEGPLRERLLAILDDIRSSTD